MSWLDKATDDLRIAEVVLESAIGIEWAVCFHSQQAAEKAIKGLLVHLDVDFPKSHSLDRLASLLPDDATEHLDLERALHCQRYAPVNCNSSPNCIVIS